MATWERIALRAEERVSKMDTLLRKCYNEIRQNSNCGEYEELLAAIGKEIDMFGKKTFNQQFNIGKAKYVVNYHDGIKTHKDGSPFSDIAIFKNKKKLQDFIDSLEAEGYIRS